MSEEEPRLEAASQGYQVYYRGRRLYSPRDPRGGAARRATAEDIAPQTLVIAASPLLGYGLEELLASAPPDATVLALELDETLAELTRRQAADSLTALEDEGDRLVVALAPTGPELERGLSRILRRRPRRTKIVALSGGFSLHATAYRDIAARLDDEIRIFWQNAMTRVRMGRLWIRNVLRNLPLVARSFPLSELTCELPTVVVGAGPSTDDHIHELPRDDDEARRGLRIISVDTAVAPLAAHGITPDLVVAVESQQANAADFLTPHARALGQAHLICDLSAYPGLPHLFSLERVSFVASTFAPTVLLDRLEDGGHLPARVPPLGSVGVLAVHLARRLTRAPVYFMGLDFAYDLERTHAAGSPFHTRALMRRSRLNPSPFFGLALSRPLLSLTDKAGRAVRSDTVLLSYAEQLRKVVEEAAEVYDLAPEAGLPTGAPPTRTPARESTAGQTHPPRGPSPRTPPRLDVETEVDTLLATEEAHLSRLIEGLREVLPRAGSDAAVADTDYAGLMPLLDAADYVYLDFPDPPAPTRAFLGRVLMSALDYQARVRRVRVMRSRLPGG